MAGAVNGVLCHLIARTNFNGSGIVTCVVIK